MSLRNNESWVIFPCRTLFIENELPLTVEGDVAHRVNGVLEYPRVGVMHRQTCSDALDDLVRLKFHKEKLRSFGQVTDQVQNLLLHWLTVTLVSQPFFKLLYNLHAHHLIVILRMVTGYLGQEDAHLDNQRLVFRVDEIAAHRNHFHSQEVHKFSCDLRRLRYYLLTVFQMLVKLILCQTVDEHEPIKRGCLDLLAEANGALWQFCCSSIVLTVLNFDQVI